MIWRSHWQSRQTLGGRRVTFAILAAMGLFAAIPYTLINRFASVRDWAAFDPTLQLDIDIPFLAWMILPYMTLYLYYPVAAWLGSKNEVMWRQNVVFHQMMLLTCWGVDAIFILLPVEIDLRHLIHGIEGTVWEPFYASMHAIDTPWNSWPSLHIVQSMQVVLVLRYWYPPTTTRLRISTRLTAHHVDLTRHFDDDHQTTLHLGCRNCNVGGWTRLGVLDETVP